MNDYPDWVDLLRYLGLDPITVWVEYRPVLFVCIGILFLSVAFGIYLLAIRVKGVIANYRHAFADRLSFHRSMTEVSRDDRAALLAALEGEPFVYAIPAIAAAEVAGFRKSVGYILLTKYKLIFTSNGQKVEYPLDSFPDANVRDGNKHMELKLICQGSKPVFHLLGINRDHAQELFMKMHALRVALKEETAS